MEGFFTAWRKLPQEKKDLVSVHQTERGEWFLSINGIRVLMQNLRAEKEGPGVSIKDIPGLDLQSYFAFRKERKTPGRRRAKNEEWEAMATTIG